MNNQTYVIAEIGINHNGDIQIAKNLITKAHDAGANAVKFQKRTIDLVYSKEELDIVRQSPWGTTNREQKEGLEFNIQQYVELEKFSNNLGLDFIVSCWDLNSLNEVEQFLNVKYHKVASAMLTDKDFLVALNETNKPLIVSIGMSTIEEITSALLILNNVEYVLSCTSTYPTPPEEVNLLRIQTLQTKLSSYKIGFSNHHSGLLACIGAVALGAKCIEFHITMDRTMYGSDQAASIENVDLLIGEIRKMEILLGSNEIFVLESEKPILKKLRKINNI